MNIYTEYLEKKQIVGPELNVKMFYYLSAKLTATKNALQSRPVTTLLNCADLLEATARYDIVYDVSLFKDALKVYTLYKGYCGVEEQGMLDVNYADFTLFVDDAQAWATQYEKSLVEKINVQLLLARAKAHEEVAKLTNKVEQINKLLNHETPSI